MTMHALSATIALPWTLELETCLRIVFTLGLLTVLWPFQRMRPYTDTMAGPYILASASLMVSYWIIGGVVLVLLHLFNALTILAMAALPRLMRKPESPSRYQLRWNTSFLVTTLESIEHPQLILNALKAYTRRLRVLRHPSKRGRHVGAIIGLAAFAAVWTASLWLRLDAVFLHAAPFYQNALQNIAWIDALAHNRWMVNGHPIPLGSFILIAEIARMGFVNPLMLEKLAASLVFIATASGLAAVAWSVTRNVAATLAALTVIGVFFQWLPLPAARVLAIGPTTIGMMGAVPAFWLMYHTMRVEHRIYGIASLALVLTSGMANVDAGILTALAAFIGWAAAWISHHVPASRAIGWLASLLLAYAVSWIPMLFQRLVSHQWAVSTTMFPMPSQALNTPELSLFEIALLLGVLMWVAVRIWISDYGAALGVLLLLVLAIAIQESSVLISWPLHLSGTRQLLTEAESLAVAGIVCFLVQDLVTIFQSLAISLVSAIAIGFGLLTGLQPVSTYTLRSDSYFYAYELMERMNRPYSWIVVSNGGSSLVAGEGYRMDPLQWTTHVNPSHDPLLYQGRGRTYRPIAQHQIFFFVERQIHRAPLPNEEFTVLREQIRNHDLKVWLSDWHASHPHSNAMTVFFQSPQLTVYRLHEGVHNRPR